MEVKVGLKLTEVGPIPDQWICSRLGDLIARGTSITYGIVQAGPHVGDGIPYIKTGDMSRSRLSTEDLARTSQEIASRYPRSTVRAGELVYSIRASVGAVHCVPPELDGANLTQGTARISPSTSVDAWYLLNALRSAACQNWINLHTKGTTYREITLAVLRQLPVTLPPTKAEQEAIAEALSDADALIEGLEQLITKKRRLKQGAMQELLTGKKRLPGFSGEWELKRFGEVVQPRTQRVDPQQTGVQAFCIELENIEQQTGRLLGFATTCETISLKSVFQKSDVLFGKLRAYLRKYWLASQDGICSTEIWALVARPPQLIPQYLFQIVTLDRFIEAASSAYGTHMPRSDWNVVKNYQVDLPSVEEQTAITAVLSDMDGEISALETMLTKARQIKQGMMQELLTGRVRLV